MKVYNYEPAPDERVLSSSEGENGISMPLTREF